MAVRKSIQFLPEIFRTDTNKKFLNATVDQLISEPNLKKVNGYIGRKLAPSYKNTDSYVEEINSERQNYQLEPSIVIKNPVTNNIEFVTTYPDIINKINYYGGSANNHTRLFDNEYYSYNPKIDLDKFINFSQYYWLPNGPDSVLITAQDVPLSYTYDVVYDSVSRSYKFSGHNDVLNPNLVLARGGVYNFVINDVGNNFYIQTKAGTTGFDSALPAINVRNVLGVTNNGADQGTVQFIVPQLDSQSEWTSMGLVGSADYATSLSYNQVQGSTEADLNFQLGGLDGLTTGLHGKTVIFVNNSYIDDVYWTSDSTVIPFDNRNDIYVIDVAADELGVDHINLILSTTVANEQKIRVRAGVTNGGKDYYSRLGLLYEVPLITAPLETIYYQNSAEEAAAGFIRLVQPTNDSIDPESEILGQITYISPNGVVFTNGLKVTFDSTTTDYYKNKTFYVEGVGTGIKLVPVDILVVPELDNTVDSPDYFTINRSSLDQNAWSRSNRWFHSNIITLSAEYNQVDPIYNQTSRAQRPIIEFDSDLQLFDFGRLALLPVNIIDTSLITNAYTQIQGIVCTGTTSNTFTVTLAASQLRIGRTYQIAEIGSTNWSALGAPTGYTIGTEFTAVATGTGTGTATDTETLTLTTGTRVIFGIDENTQVRNKIYDFSITLVGYDESLDPIYKGYIEESDDTLVDEGHTVVVTDGTNGNQQWYYTGTEWTLGQQKNSINQNPLFDVIGSNGISFSNQSAYLSTGFFGTKIFSYKLGTGNNDPVLGIPLSYKNFVSQGDIQFENNYDNDSFTYLLADGTSKTISINAGFLQKNISRIASTRENIWTINKNFSKQYQIYSFVYDGLTNLFSIDHAPDISVNVPNTKVVINNQFITAENFATTQVVDKLTILVNPDLLTVGDAVFISIYNSTDIAPNAFYEVPQNLDINTLNNNLDTLTLGQIRNHLVTLKNNSLNIIGDVPGSSNLRDISYLNAGGSILQHSAPVVYSGLFLNHPTMDYVNSLQLAGREYSKFKVKFLELAANLELNRDDVSGSVDKILQTINKVKNDSFPWYYSDMLPYGENDRVILPDYTVYNPDIVSYEITNIFQDTVLSNKAIMVYLTRTIDSITTKTLLVKGRDYYFNQDRPAITFQSTFKLLYSDIISIIEYSSTDGSYIPETPTKLGLHPRYIPEIYLDDTYVDPVNVIQGHDGSITPAFDDFRDDFLIELERRIFNNLKVEYDPGIFNLYDYIPGKFRNTEYSLKEFNQVLSTGFLTWCGTNKIDYSTNKTFSASNPFTWNYKNFRDVVDGENLPGSWRAVYKYFYDTDRPHTNPWEMLGFSEKPDYWDDRYGPAPYTGGNEVLWSDLSVGYIHAGNRAGFDIRFQRPNLNLYIPVDASGNLRSPEQILVANFDSAKASASFASGDLGPVEAAWRRSSDFSFTLQLAFALTKPAKYFSLLCDVTNFNRNSVTSQFVTVSNGQHLTPTSININGYDNNGTIERVAGYINWIRDYVKNLGIADASNIIKTNLSRLTVQLSYRLSGFTDKKYIQLLAEQSSPSSINDSVVIPDENYKIDLYKGAPTNKIVYSAVIVEKTANGYSVSGYDTINPYFYMIPSLVNNNSYVINGGNLRGVVYKNFKKTKLTIPYGFEFNTYQQVVDFLVGYQRYLQAKGFIFVDTENSLGEQKDWILSAKEFLNWVSQGWKLGSILVLSPVSTTLKVYDAEAVVDEIINSPFASRVLDINAKPITKNNFTILRESNQFSFTATADQSIGFASLNLIQYEHLLLIDNVTVFQDIVYLPELGNRQYRLKLVGAKTADWTGSLELPGFIYSSNKNDLWQPSTDYLKGTTVIYKSKYYVALQNIPAADQFQTSYWKEVSSTQIQSGMINNFATNAQQFINYYDVNDQPIDESLQLFSNGLIGFRSRDYFTNLGIDSVTQAKFYQGLIKEKGTLNAVNALKGAVFNNLETIVNVYENWAVRVGEFGATDVNSFTEISLKDTEINSNPAAIQFDDSSVVAEDNIITYKTTDIYKAAGRYTANLFKTQTNTESKTIKPLPVAGFVHLDDVDGALFNINDYVNYPYTEIGTGYKLWIARNNNNVWDVLRANYIGGIVFALRYKLDDIVEVIVNIDHGLSVDDVVSLKNFNTLYDGAYRVNSIIDSTRFEIQLYKNLTNIIQEQVAVGNGLLFKFTSMRTQNPHLIESLRPTQGWLENDKVWIDDLDGNQNWAVYNKTSPWVFSNQVILSESQYAGNDHFGAALSISPNGLVMYSGAPDSVSGRVAIFAKVGDSTWTPNGFLRGNSGNLDSYGKSLANGTENNSNYLVIGAPDSENSKGWVYIYKDQILIQILSNPLGSSSSLFGQSIAMSDNSQYLYVGSPGIDKVFCYTKPMVSRTETSQLFNTNGVDDTFSVVASVTDPTYLIVGNSYTSVDYIPTVDYTVSQYTSGVKTFLGSYDNDGSSNRYTISGSVAVNPSPTLEVAYYGIATTGGVVVNIFRTQGSSLYTVELVNAGSGRTVGDTLTILGTSLGGFSPLNDLTLTVDSITDGTNISFTSTPALNNRISVIQRADYYVLIGTLPTASENAGSNNFGYSVACNSDGSTVVVGAKDEAVDSIDSVGAVYAYHRTISKFTTNGITGTYTPLDPFNSVYRVYLDNVLLIEPNDYYISGPAVQFGVYNIPIAGKTLTVETNQFIFDQKISSSFQQTRLFFGSIVKLCSTGCNLYVTSPGYKETNYSSGLVSRYINVGSVYGEVTGSISNPSLTPGNSFIINDYPIAVSGATVSDLVAVINAKNIPGISASLSNSKLKITSDVVLATNKLDIKTGFGTVLEDLGIGIYQIGQTLKHPEKIGEVFGKSIAVSQTSGTMAVGSDGADIEIVTTYDAESTVFDAGSTRSISVIRDSGAVYIFNLLSNPFEYVDSPSLFAYTQKLTGPNIETGFNFGADLAIHGESLVVGVINDNDYVTQGGSVYSYINVDEKSGWELIRYNQPRVDIETINSAYIYNKKTQVLISYFDFIDPAKGKLLGVADQEIDYREIQDPASYNNASTDTVILNPNFYWSSLHVSKLWWDLSVVSFVDSEQGSLTYRTNNWGKLFPGSQVKIYEWVASDFLPSQYVANGGDGIPKYLDNSAYSTVTIVDPSTGIITQKYYYWVGDKTTVDSVIAKRTLSAFSLQSYISNPKDQGNPYLAYIAPNSVALFNVTDALTDDDIILHLDTSSSKSQNLIHNEFQLIQEGNPISQIPSSILIKLRDSLSGSTISGDVVPDPTLSAEDQIGLLNRPRQSLFVNGLNALTAFIKQVNSVVIKYPILLISANVTSLYAQDPIPNVAIDSIATSYTQISYLDPAAFYDGYTVLIENDPDYLGKWTIYKYSSDTETFNLYKIQSYKTTLYWDQVDWYSSDYVSGTDISFVVGTYGNIQSLSLASDMYIKVLDGGNGQWLIYVVNSDLSLTLIAAQNATVEFSSNLYDSTTGSGFESTVFDIINFDPQPGIEVGYIFDSLHDEILINDLAVEFNSLFFTVVNYLHTEQISPDWIFKTSLIDVYHNLRKLEQLPNYIKDDQTFYENYINEIKPYRTKLREYVPTYSKTDTATGEWTDFDLPAIYYSSTSTYRSPDVGLPQDQEILTTKPFSDWTNNYKFKVADFIIGNVGLNYTIAPNVEITGGGGSGATAITTINPSTGQLTGVQVVTPGSGYTTTPTVYINGVGQSAVVYPVLKNEFNVANPALSYNLVREINTKLKFDRFSYSSNLELWSNNKTYSNTVIAGSGSNIWVTGGNVIVYNSEVYIVSNANPVTESIFDFTRFTKVDSGNVLLNAVDRIAAYYDPAADPGINSALPSKSLDKLMSGVEYPGVKVTGPEFRSNIFEVSGNTFSFNTIGLTITSGNVQAINFRDLGFQVDQPVRIETLVPFNFVNNGTFYIVNVERDYLMLTGKPIETTHKMILSSSVTVSAGDIITQANTLANAYVLQNATNSQEIDVVYNVSGFSSEVTDVISINGATQTKYIADITPGGNANVRISYLNLFDILDSNIYSTYLDTELGTRPEDINIVGGAYVDTYSSHAPEELIPGKMFDALEIRVFSNTASNTATYGFRVFQPMSSNIQFSRISANNTTALSSNLSLGDPIIYVTDASILPFPSPGNAIPGIVFINGEKIHYYQKYDDATIADATAWEPDTYFLPGTLVSNISSNTYLVLGNIYANSNTYINTNNLQQVYTNTLTQLRRGVDGTGSPVLVTAGNLVADSSLQQQIPDGGVAIKTFTTFDSNVTSNVTWQLTLSGAITANIGDYITQFVGNTGNVRILSSVVSANVVAVDIIGGNVKLAANVGTRINIATPISYTTTTANIIAITPLGSVRANGNVVLSGVSLLRSNLWVPLSTGVGLEGSTTTAAEFIKAEPSYIP